MIFVLDYLLNQKIWDYGGKYILHANPGDILSDIYILEDLYYLVEKYSLDTIRFGFSLTPINSIDFKKYMKFKPKSVFSNVYTRIIYGKPNYNVHLFFNIYLFIWLEQVLITSCTIFSTGM